MARMIDRLFAYGSLFTGDDGQSKQLQIPHDCNLFAQAEVFAIDNVGEYFFAETPQDYWDLGTDFPCVTLPYPVTWMEMRRPSQMNINGTIQSAADFPHSFGMLLAMHETTDADGLASISHTPETLGKSLNAYAERHAPLLARFTDATQGLDYDAMRAHVQSAYTPVEEAILVGWVEQLLLYKFLQEQGTGALQQALQPGQLYEHGVRWIVTTLPFMEMVPQQILGPIVQVTFYLDGLGKIVPLPDNDARDRHCVHVGAFRPVTTEHELRALESAGGLLYPFLLALAFLQCKNVTVTEHAPGTAGHPALRKRYHGRPRAVYRTLDIAPMTQALRTEGRSHEVGVGRALSICRGHFKDYTAGKGLFGRLNGLYWWSNHL